MSEGGDSFVVYDSYLRTARELPDGDYERYVTAICEYGVFDKEPTWDNISPKNRPACKMAFVQIRASLDASHDRYAASVENGKKGGRPKKYNEKDILAAIKMGGTKGLSARQIAKEIGCSRKTVDRAIKKEHLQGVGQNRQNPNDNGNDKGIMSHYHGPLSVASPEGGNPPPSQPIMTTQEMIAKIKAKEDERLRAEEEKRMAQLVEEEKRRDAVQAVREARLKILQGESEGKVIAED